MAEADLCSEGSGFADTSAALAIIRTKQLANFMSKMAIVRSDVLRAIPAYKALAACGAVFRPRQKASCDKSQMVERIQEFWSHSWHGKGGGWKKYSTLLVLKNGMPAVLLGSLFALMGLGLFLLGVLPGKPGSLSSVWSLVFGVLSSCGVFALWRHSKLVFLDHICINQADDEMKAGAICSLAGLLNKSDSMLVLWDESYTERLWCVFELAAFLKSTKALGRPLVICPTLAGPCSVLGFLIVSGVFLPIAISPLRHADLLWRPAVMVAAVSIASSVAAQVFRGLCRSVEVMQKQLLSLKVANTKCTCCIVGHVMDGERLLCDRQAICECMASWFGSVEEFEHCIRSEVVEVVSRELDRAAFGHAFYLGMAAPAFWAILDILPTPVVSGQPLELVFWLTAASIMLGLVFPMYLACARFLAFHFRYKSRNVFGEILKDLMVVLFASPVLAYALGVFLFCSEFCPHLFAPIQAAVFCCMILPMWFSMWLFRRCHGDNCFSRSLSQYRLAVQSC